MIVEVQYNTVPAMSINTAYTAYTVAESSIIKPQDVTMSERNLSYTVYTLVECVLT